MKRIVLIMIMLFPIFGFGQSEQADIYYKLGVTLYNKGKYESAITCFLESEVLEKQELDSTSKKYNRSSLAIAYCCFGLAEEKIKEGDYVAAIGLQKKVLDSFDKYLGKEHSDYITSLNKLTSYNFRAGNYIEAVRLGHLTAEICRKVFGDNHPKYAICLDNLALYNSKIGNYHDAIKIGFHALKIFRNVLGEEDLDYAQSLSNIALISAEIGQYTEAIEFGIQAMEIFKKKLGEEHPQYATSLDNLACYNRHIGNYAEAIRFGTQALEIYRKVVGENHQDYAVSLSNLSSYNSYVGNYTEAIRLGKQAVEIEKKILGEEHPNYATSLNNLAFHYLDVKQYSEASILFEQAYKCLNSFIMRCFLSMTNKERDEFWNKYSYFFREELPFVAYKTSSLVQTSLAYNGLLLSKGLLLNAELEIQKLIEKSSDTTFANCYHKIRSYRTILDKLYQIPLDRRPMNADSLSKVIERAERLIVVSSKELGDYTKSLSIEWKDVQNKLTDKDIAIEFADFYDYDEKTQRYVALILKKGMSAPEIIKLFDLGEFTSIDTSVYYKSDKLYNLVWKPLQKYLQGVENVYFSPSGQLHTIGIEYLYTGRDNEIFSQKYKVHRLSSTRELALNHSKIQISKAAVYGGLRYNFGDGDWVTNTSKNNIVFRDVPSFDNDDWRAGLKYLPGSLEEANAVTNILRGNGVNVALVTEKQGTEESFKSLSGSRINMMLIATHGFYEPKDTVSKDKRAYLFFEGNNREDNSLSRSGLFLAGALSAYDGNAQEGFEDGILTAREISRLDFSGLDLVVLSACETGLGEITGDGVFGLQRGFKKAGAHTMVMSLWKVSDEATQMLMTEFFKEIVAGKNKREAFVEAQTKLRTKYSDPKLWAAFILVDDI